MHFFYINILILDVFYMFWTRELIFRKMVVYTYKTAYTNASKTYHTCIYNVHDHPLYLVYPGLLCVVGEIS